MLLSISDDLSRNACLFLWDLQEMGGGWEAFFNDLPLLFDGKSFDDCGSLVKIEISNDWDLSVVKLRNVNVIFSGLDYLLYLSISDQWNADESLNGDSVLRNVNVSQDGEVDGVLNGLRNESSRWAEHW